KPSNSLQLFEQLLREKAGAAIGIHEQFMARRNESRDQIAQGIGDSVVRLGKNAGTGFRAQSVMAVANRSGAQIRERAIHFGHRDRAMFDVDQAMRFAAEEPNHAILGMNGDAIAITIRRRRGNDWPHRHIVEFSDATQDIVNLTELKRQLMLVIDVLVTAS